MARHNAQTVTMDGDSITVRLASGSIDLPVIPLPDKYAAWIDSGRRTMYQKILDEDFAGIRFFPQHLPVVVTQSSGKTFPCNCGNKGVGFVPRQEYLPELIDLFQETHDRTRSRPWKESLRERVQAVSSFYVDDQKIERRAMATLEIFERTTFENLQNTPLASLLFTGHLPEYTSFQLNCAVEVVDEDDPRHTFLKLSRTMFEYDNFHIAQPRFRYAYIFWISEVLDKTPFRVQKHQQPAPIQEVKRGLPWQPDAVAAVNRAPGMIQEYIRERVEEFARERGFEEVTLEVVREAKDNAV